jgi:dihydroxy-acid dehydratase
MLHATGLGTEDLNKAQVGIASVWYEGNPCNMHLLDLAAHVKAGVQEAGMVGMRFNTVGVSDAISMGTEGMSFSLQSRDLIADSIETVMGGQWYDANVSIPGCDKNMLRGGSRWKIHHYRYRGYRHHIQPRTGYRPGLPSGPTDQKGSM